MMLPALTSECEVAMHRAVDPVSLVALRARPQEVGALLWRSQRIEPALYHKSSVVDDEGEISGISPVSRLAFDGWDPMPSLADLENFVDFVDWDSDGWVRVPDLAVAYAAILPLDVEATDSWIRDHFDVDQDGFIWGEALVKQAEPRYVNIIADLLLGAPALEPPEVCRRSGREELSRWFDHWDVQGGTDSGHEVIEVTDLRFGIAYTLYKSLGSSMDLQTKQAVTSLFLVQSGLEAIGRLKRADFLELLAPALCANLPEMLPMGAMWSTPGLMVPEAEFEDPIQVNLHVPWRGTVEDTLRVGHTDSEVEFFNIFRNWRVRELRLAAAKAAGLPQGQRVLLYISGRPLPPHCEAALVTTLPGLVDGAVLQVLPDCGYGAGCSIS